MKKSLHTFCFLLLLPLMGFAEDAPSIRVGALAFGTLAWELAAIERTARGTQPSLKISTQVLSSPEAGRIALQGNSTDLIVTDWIFVAQQRLKGQDYTFVPFSSLSGALVVPKDSPIRDLSDLKAKRIGVAGGGLDKNWLLLKRVAQKEKGLDLEKDAEIQFGAPPLLSETLKRGQLDAVLTYWNHAVRLEQLGYRILARGSDLQTLLGLQSEIPTLGYVFRDSWAKAHPEALNLFLRRARDARESLCDSDKTWASIEAAVGESDQKTREALRTAYCRGGTHRMGPREIEEASTLFEALSNPKVSETDFWNGVFHQAGRPDS